MVLLLLLGLLEYAVAKIRWEIPAIPLILDLVTADFY